MAATGEKQWQADTIGQAADKAQRQRSPCADLQSNGENVGHFG